MKAALIKLLLEWRKLTKDEVRKRLLKIAAILPMVLLLSGCGTTEPTVTSGWDYYGWDINAPAFTPVTNHIYRP